MKNIHLHYMDCDSFVLNIKTKNKNIDSKNLEYFLISVVWMKIMNYSVLKKQKLLKNIKLKRKKNFWIDEVFALRSKCYAFKCGDDSENKSKGISKSQSKNIKFEEFKICLDGEENKKVCDK